MADTDHRPRVQFAMGHDAVISVESGRLYILTIREVEGGHVPTSDWLLNLQILTSGGYRCVPDLPHH